MSIWKNGWIGVSKLTFSAAVTGALLAVVVWSSAQGQAPGDLQTVEGKVRSFTTAPLGEVDGLRLRTSK